MSGIKKTYRPHPRVDYEYNPNLYYKTYGNTIQKRVNKMDKWNIPIHYSKYNKLEENGNRVATVESQRVNFKKYIIHEYIGTGMGVNGNLYTCSCPSYANLNFHGNDFNLMQHGVRNCKHIIYYLTK